MPIELLPLILYPILEKIGEALLQVLLVWFVEWSLGHLLKNSKLLILQLYLSLLLKTTSLKEQCHINLDVEIPHA